VQLLASKPTDLRQALEALEKAAASTHPWFRNIRAIDLNFGCPSPAVIQEGSGPALLKRKKRLGELFAVLVAWRDANSLGVLAVGAKIRLGMSAGEVKERVYVDVGRTAAEAGLDYITVHGRHAGQRSSEAASWEAIREVKEAVGDRLAVIANGDVRSSADAHALLFSSGADGIMLGRAAMRNPWVFADMPRVPPPRPTEGRGKAMPPVGQLWPAEGTWPTVLQVNASEAAWAAWAAQGGGTREKHKAFHAANFKRLRDSAALAFPNARTRPPLSPSTVHLT
jgi:tRNA-dihydrouridine synthase